MTTNQAIEITEIKPRLKTGAIVTAISNTKPQSHFIGHASAGIQISHPAAAAILANFTGSLTCFEISIRTGAPFEIVNKICDELVAANLIDQVATPIVLADRFHSEKANRKSHFIDQSKDVAYQQLQERIAPELGQITRQTERMEVGAVADGERRSG